MLNLGPELAVWFEEPLHWWAESDWWLLIVAFLTGGVIAWQSWETRKAAEGAKVAAESSLKQADAQITSERAWLVIRSSMEGCKPYSDEIFAFKWLIENKGNTPARVIETQCRYELVQRQLLTELGPDPNYPAPISLSGFLLPPGASANYSTYLLSGDDGKVISCLDQSGVNVIKIGLFRLRVYGYVRYLDAFENERESRFCEYYDWPSDQCECGSFRPLLGISPSYTKHT